MANIAAAGGGSPSNASPVSRVTLSAKYTCIIKPAQSGKTRTMQEMMVYYEQRSRELNPGDAGLINIVICSKNLNLVKQTHARMTDIIALAPKPEPEPEPDSDNESDRGTADATIDGVIFSWMTGTKDTNITPDDLAMKIQRKKVRMVVCCAHPKRLRYVAKLLEAYDDLSTGHRFNVWMDEADDYTNVWTAVDLSQFTSTLNIYLVSATIDDIVDKHKRVKVMPYTTTFPLCYRGLADVAIVRLDLPTRDATEYVKQAYAIHKGTLCVPGMRLFAPGSDLVESHNAIATFFGTEGFAVAVIDGPRKCILVPGMVEPLSILKHVEKGKPMEIGKVIAKMYRDYNLARFPFVITGKLCLGRGITFQDEVWKKVSYVDEGGDEQSEDVLDYDFLFDAGIVPHMNKAPTLYQCASRMGGNTANFVNYKQPTMITPTENHIAMLKRENIAKNLAILVSDHNLADIGWDEMEWAHHGDEEKYHKAVEDRNNAVARKVHDENAYTVGWSEEFATLEALKAAKLTTRIPGVNGAGFYNNPHGKKPLTRAQFTALKSGKKTAHMRLGEGRSGVAHRTYVFYENPTDPSTARFVVCTLTRNG